MDPRPDGASAPTTGPNTSLSAVRDATTTPTPNNPQTAVATNLPTSSTASPSVYPTFQHVPSSMMEIDNTTVAEDRSRRATSVLSMDDIEAAQALEGLRTGGLIHFPFFDPLFWNIVLCLIFYRSGWF